MNDLMNAGIYLTGALFCWRWLHYRAVEPWVKALLIITVVWGIAGATVTFH